MSDINFSIGGNSYEFQAAMAQVNQSIAASRKSVLAWGADLTMVLHGVRRAVQLFSQAWSQAARFEDARTRFTPLIGSLERSRELCEALRNEAANGTMDFERLVSVAGRLATVFKSTENIKKWTTAFHDLSAGTGLDVNELIGNFVKAKASGRFEAGFVDMFAQKGVNLYEPLAKELNMGEAALRKLAQTGELSFGQIEKALVSLTGKGGAFAGMAEKMSSTASGTFSTMLANLQILIAKFAEPINEAITPVLAAISEKITAVMPLAQGLGKILGTSAGAFAALSAAVALATVKMQGFAAASSFSGVVGNVSALAAKFRELFTATRTTALYADVCRARVAALGVGMRGWISVVREGLSTATTTGNYFAQGYPKIFAAAKIVTTSFAAAFRVSMLAVKSALISTGIGAAVWALGEAVGFVVNKLSAASNSAKQFDEALKSLNADAKELNAAFSDESSLAGIERLKTEKLKETMKIFEHYAEYGMTLNELARAEKDYANGDFVASDYEGGGQLLALLRARAEIRRAAGEAETKLIARQAADQRAAELKAEAEELEQARAHSVALRAEIAKREAELRRSAAQSVPEKIRAELDLAGAGSRTALDAELESLKRASELTAEQKSRAEALLAAKERIAKIDADANSTRASLREKIALMQAELESSEKLAEAKEKIYLAELKTQFAAAGQSPAQAAESAQRMLDLEKQLETKRAADKSGAAVSAEEQRLALLRAELSGNAQLAEQLREQLIAANKNAGMDAAEAERLARERVSLETAQAAANGAGSGAAQRVGAGTVGTAQASVGGGRSVSIGMSGAISVAREQLSAAKQMLVKLDKIAANTAGGAGMAPRSHDDLHDERRVRFPRIRRSVSGGLDQRLQLENEGCAQSRQIDCGADDHRLFLFGVRHDADRRAERVGQFRRRRKRFGFRRRRKRRRRNRRGNRRR